jgi:hypothetical protein
LFRKTPLLKIREWRQLLNFAFIVNIIGFLSILAIFMLRYGAAGDDIAYYGLSLNVSGLSILKLKTGTDFMCWITRPLRQYLHMNLISLHLLFFSIGFSGSLIFLYILAQRLDFSEKSQRLLKQLALLTLMCFPNFLAWGRFYGKDSIMLFLVSVFALGAWKALSGARIKLIQLIALMMLPLWFMHIIRPHIAMVLSASALAMITYRVFFSANKIQNIGLQGLVKFYIPLLLLLAAGVFGQNTLRKMVGGTSEVNRSSVENTIVAASHMGAYGGSTTALATDLNEDKSIIFSPVQIAKNIFNLLFSPLPWHVRNAVDVLALLANVLLLLLLVKYANRISLGDLYQKFLFLCLVFLSLVLSYLTGNVGLILRQKTIILPFIFLLLFSTKKKNADKSPANRDDLSKPRFNT